MGKLKDFELDFDEISIHFPDGDLLKVSIKEQLLVNKDLPADILMKMSKCAAIYARWGSIRADLASYLSKVEDDYEVFLKRAKNKARDRIEEKKPAETRVEEKAILGNLDKYKEYRKTLRLTSKNIEKVKRIMRALEIQSELSRSMTSYAKKELDLTDTEDTIIGRGSLKTARGGKRNA